MSSDSHVTISYTSISSYEVIVNGYYGMSMDPLDPYVQLFMGAPPVPDYIPGPEAPPSPYYIPRPDYPEYLPPADDVLPAEEQPLPATVSPSVESPRYIADSEPEIDPEEEDGDDEESEEDSIDYPTSRRDDDANDDGDELSDDDADDEDEEESSDREEEEEEHLALTRARFTTPTSRYEIGESSVVASARQIRPTLTIADKHRANDKLIGRLRRERQYFRTLATTYAQEVAHSRDYCTQIMDYCQLREVHTRTLVTQIEALQRDKMEPKRARTTRANPDPTRTTTATEPMTQEAINNLIARHNKSVSNISNCIAENQVKFASCTLIGSALTWWNSHMRAVGQEVAYAMPWKTLKQMMTAKYCPRGEVKKLEVKLWNLKVKGTDITSYTLRYQELSLLCGRMFPEESDEIERYVGRLPEMIWGNVMSYEPKSMQKAIESANEKMYQKLIGIADRQAENKRKFDNTSRNQQNQQPFKRNNKLYRPML
nr:reverse transcriptase domain-containing protein [Tanacetum cinerariifolium]